LQTFIPRFGDIYSWDIAAGHAILKAFGGDVLDSDLQEISYDMKEKQLIKGFFAFSNKERLDFLKTNRFLDYFYNFFSKLFLKR
jgi:3'-phosphoadenosine 5'-phosphosulfate (PAPS) 3'-phosphatase